jgi:hypothetical protein
VFGLLLSFLDGKSMCAMSHVNRDLNRSTDFTHARPQWQALLASDFKVREVAGDANLKAQYLEQVAERGRRAAAARAAEQARLQRLRNEASVHFLGLIQQPSLIRCVAQAAEFRRLRCKQRCTSLFVFWQDCCLVVALPLLALAFGVMASESFFADADPPCAHAACARFHCEHPLPRSIVVGV